MAEKYISGKGRLYFASFLTGTQNTGGERYLGNAPAVSISFEAEMLDHYRSTGGIKEKDESVTIKVNRSGSMELDSMEFENLAMLFFGSTANVAQSAGSVLNEVVAIDAKDRYFQLGVSALAPSGARSLSAVVVTNVAGSTTYVSGTDYVLDAVRGRIYIPLTSTIAVGSIHVDYTKAAVTLKRVVSGNTPIEGQLRFLADNPVGEDMDYLLPWVKITPNGEFPLITDDWMKMSFKLEVLKKGDLEAAYIDGQPL
jgi:hypothetical protein